MWQGPLGLTPTTIPASIFASTNSLCLARTVSNALSARLFWKTEPSMAMRVRVEYASSLAASLETSADLAVKSRSSSNFFFALACSLFFSCTVFIFASRSSPSSSFSASSVPLVELPSGPLASAGPLAPLAPLSPRRRR